MTTFWTKRVPRETYHPCALFSSLGCFLFFQNLPSLCSKGERKAQVGNLSGLQCSICAQTYTHVFIYIYFGLNDGRSYHDGNETNLGNCFWICDRVGNNSKQCRDKSDSVRESLSPGTAAPTKATPSRTLTWHC